MALLSCACFFQNRLHSKRQAEDIDKSLGIVLVVDILLAECGVKRVPEEDDAFLTPTGHLGSEIALSIEGEFIGNFADTDDAEKELVGWINKNKVFPSIWFIDDHGGSTPYQISKSNQKKLKW